MKSLPELLAMGDEELNRHPFWRNVRKTESCWWWEGRVNDRGYGTFYHEGKNVFAHHYLNLDKRPSKDHIACHHCDHPLCVREDHIYWGTRKDNSRDMLERGGYYRGSRHCSSKLTDAQVLEIKTCEWSDTRSVELANKFGVNITTVRRIRKGIGWAHIPSRNTASNLTNKPVMVTFKDGRTERFPSMDECAEALNMSGVSIGNWLSGKHRPRKRKDISKVGFGERI